MQKELKKMKKTVLSTVSVTYAMKGIRLLSSNKLPCKLVKIDTNTSGYGCTHGIMLNDSDFFSAVKILRENNIPYSIHRDDVSK